MAKNVLITGGAGFIGSNLARSCVEKGWNVSVVDDLSAGRKDFVPTGVKRFYIGDFADDLLVDKTGALRRYDVVFHLAAQPRVSYSVEHPLETHDTNVTKTVKFMNACRGGHTRFIFASSSSVYGPTDVIPTTEAVPRNPQSPYALHKAVIEDYLKLYSNLYSMDCAALRFFNVYGPNQLGSSPYSTAVSAWLTAIKLGVPMRSDGDGLQTRDMVHVSDVASALICAAESPHKLNGDVFNVGTGKAYTNKEIRDTLLSLNPGSTYVNAPERAGDVKHTLASINKIAAHLGWHPQVDFWNGLDATSKWYDENWEKLK